MRINQLLNVPSQYYQPNQLETKMRTLIKLPIFLALMLVIFCCLLSSAHAIEPDYIGISGRVQDMKRVNWVKAHSHTREPIYIFNSEQDVVDRLETLDLTAIKKIGDEKLKQRIADARK